MKYSEETFPFTVLENKTIGRNITNYRKVREIKAADLAKQLGMKEATYTKYERGETAITVEFIQNVAQILKIDPLMLLSISPSNFIENVSNSPIAIHGYSYYQTTNEQQTQAMIKLLEGVMKLNEKLVELLSKQG